LAVREEEYAWLVVDLPSLIVVPVDYSPEVGMAEELGVETAV